MSWSASLRVRVEQGIPKLLVKIHPVDADSFSAKNLGEVTLRKDANNRGHVAVLHMSNSVARGEVLMSFKLAELLGLEEDENVEVTTAQLAGVSSNHAAAQHMGTRMQAQGPGRPEAPLLRRDMFATGQSQASQASPTMAFRRPSSVSIRLQASGEPRRQSVSGGSARGHVTASPNTRVVTTTPPVAMGASPCVSPGARAEAARGATAASAPKARQQASDVGEVPRRVPLNSRFERVEQSSSPTSLPGHSSLARGMLSSSGLGRQPSVSSTCESKSTNVPMQADDHAELGATTSGVPWYHGFAAQAGRGSSVRAQANADVVANAKAPIASPELRSRGPPQQTSNAPTRLASRYEAWPQDNNSSSRPSASLGQRGTFGMDSASTDRLDRCFLGAGARAGSSSSSAASPTQHCRRTGPAPQTGTRTQPSDAFDGFFADRLAGRGHRHGLPTRSTMDTTPNRRDSGVSENRVDSLPPSDEDDCSPTQRSSPRVATFRVQPRQSTVAWPSSHVGSTGNLLQGTPLTQAHPCSAATAADVSINLQEGPPPSMSGAAVKGSTAGRIWSGSAQGNADVADSLDSASVLSHAPSCSSSPELSPRGQIRAGWQVPTTDAQDNANVPKSSDVNDGVASTPMVTETSDGVKWAPEPPKPSVTSHKKLLRAQTAIVPTGMSPRRATSKGTPSGNSRRSRVLGKRASTLGTLQLDAPAQQRKPTPRHPLPSHWKPPVDTGGGLERSELGNEITAEVRRWLLGETTGLQCSQVVLDRALTVLSNFKLASGCQLEVLGGPLGAIVGGYSDADFLHDEIFNAQPEQAVQDAFQLLGFQPRGEGDWSSYVAEEVSLAYRRMCLRGHPSRGGAPHTYLKLQVAMELVRAFAGEAGPLEPASNITNGYTLNDISLARELQLSAKEVENEASAIPLEQLEEMNRGLDEYILRLMCFKSEIVDEIARLHEDSAYAILGVSSRATDAEIKRAYRVVAMQCHPDKGGDKEDFQELTSAYEKIMEQRQTHKPSRGDRKGSDDDSNSDEASTSPMYSQKPWPGGRNPAEGKQQEQQKHTEPASSDGTQQATSNTTPANGPAFHGPEDDPVEEDSSGTSLVEKAAKAAEEASRYAKTAAEFAHQAADAAETARQGREKGSHDTLTKSIAHSAIVLTLTVVKAVRVVGYATLDVAAQCRIAAKRSPSAAGCAERSVSAMTLGLEALNSALACAEVTETTAAELQAPSPLASTEPDCSTAAAERFVGAAVRASLAAASASNAAMSAAIAAVEGSRECAQAVTAPQPAPAGGNSGQSNEAASGKEERQDTPQDGKVEKEEDAEEAKSESSDTVRKPPAPQGDPVDLAMKRLVAQRSNNHKVLKRLNAEILSHQQNVKQFLQQNRQLIPDVSSESKMRITALLRDYAREAHAELETVLHCVAAGLASPKEVLASIRELALLVPFLHPQGLAIPVSVKPRVLKMAAIYDLPLTSQVLEEEVFGPAQTALAALPKSAPAGGSSDCDWRRQVDELRSRTLGELGRSVAEEEDSVI